MPSPSVAALGLVAAAAALFAAGLAAGAARAARSSRAELLPGLFGCLLATAAGAVSLGFGAGQVYHGVAVAARLVPAVELDALAAFFLVVIGLGGLVHCLIAWHSASAPQPVAVHAVLLGLLLAIVAADGYTLLAGWGLTILGVACGREQVGGRAIGLGLVAAALVLLGGDSAGYDFAALADVAPGSGRRWAASLLFACGFTALAGMPPFHAARIRAASGSTLATVTGGLIPAAAICGLARCLWGLLDGGPQRLAIVLIVAGGCGAVYATLRAIADTDLERVAAYWTTGYASWSLVAFGSILGTLGDPSIPSNGLAVPLAIGLNLTLASGALAAAVAAVAGYRGTADLDARGGPIPRRAISALLLAGVALTGLPPASGFLPVALLLDVTSVGAPTPLAATGLALAALATALLIATQLACLMRLAGVLLANRAGEDSVSGAASNGAASNGAAGNGAAGNGAASNGAAGNGAASKGAAGNGAAGNGAAGNGAAASVGLALGAVLAIAGALAACFATAVTSAALAPAAAATATRAPLALGALAAIGGSAMVWMLSRRTARRPSRDAIASTASGMAQPLTSELTALFRVEEATELVAGHSAYHPVKLRFLRTVDPIPRAAARILRDRLTNLLEAWRTVDLTPPRVPGVAYVLAAVVVLLLVMAS